MLVTENLLGDILSDLGAGLVGGLGSAPSAMSATGTRWSSRVTGLPGHRGPGRRQPIGRDPFRRYALGSPGRLHHDPSPRAAARRIEAAVAAALAAGDAQTADIGGRWSTTEATRAILRRLA